MFGSGWILILASLVSWASFADGFDHKHIPDAIESCEGRLFKAARKAPTLDENLREYVARLSSLKRESRFHFTLSREDAGAPIADLMKRRSVAGSDFLALSEAGLVVWISENHLDIVASSSYRLLYRHELDQPLWRVQYHPDGPGSGYLSLIGWSRTHHLRFANQHVQPVEDLPEGVTADVLIPRTREGEVAAERQRLLAHARQPASPSLLLEAMGELAERVVNRADAACRGQNLPFAGGDYPHSLLAMAALALRRDPVMRSMIADAINEHVHGRMQFRTVFDEDRVFVILPEACAGGTLSLTIPADPFQNPDGFARLKQN